MTITNLVLEGGGIRALSYLGALEELETRKMLFDVQYFAGSSAGGFLAALLAMKFTPKDISHLFDTIDITETIPNYGYVRRIWHVLKHWGMYPTDGIRNAVKTIICNKFDEDLTLGELYFITGNYLVLTVCCLDTMSPVYLNPNTYSHVKLIDAMVATISVPGFFEPKVYNFDSRSYYYIDGGVVDNYPLWIFNDLSLLESGQIHEIDKLNINPNTLGLKLLSENEENTPNIVIHPTRATSLRSYATLLWSTINIQLERINITSSYIKQTIAIKSNIAPLNFNVSAKQRLLMAESGKKAVVEYLSINK